MIKQKVYGYVRVSTKEQNEDRQYAAMKQFGIDSINIYQDKLSGKNFDRPNYQRLVRRKLKTDDVLVVKSIDRLGRNYEEIIEEWRFITKEIKANIVVLDMPLLDTRPSRDLLGTLISDIVLQILSFVAENEREMIRQRQAEGIAAAKARGVHLGRFPTPLPENFNDIYQKWRRKELSAVNAAEHYQISLRAFYRLIEKYEKTHEIKRA